MPKPLVYIESSVISYLAARPSRDIIRRAKQIETAAWWERRDLFDLLISTVVVEEAQKGHPDMAAKRMTYCAGIRSATLSDRAAILAAEVLRRTGLPESARADAVQIGIAAIEDADFLITWNLKHIAGAGHQPRIESACAALGLRKPVICTPPQLMELGYA